MLQQVTVYIDTSFKGKLNAGTGTFSYVIEYIASDNQMYTIEDVVEYTGTTKNRIAVLAVIEALNRLRKTCDITLYINSQYVVEAVEQKWIQEWIANNWNNKNGEQVKNKDLWKKIAEYTIKHIVKFEFLKESNYAGCMKLRKISESREDKHGKSC